MSEDKVRSKTEEFKIALQAKVTEVLGEKVSKQKAWDLFKELTKTPFSFILANYEEAGKPEIVPGCKLKELEVPLAGVGTFKVIPVGKNEKFSVKGRWYISSAIDRAIKERLGFADGSDEAVEVDEDPVEVDAPEEDSKEATSSSAIDLDIDL